MENKSILPSVIDKRGYLLIEALIAMVIFSVGFMAIGSTVVYTTRNNTRAHIATQATMLATNKMEEIKLAHIASLPTVATVFDDPNNPIDQNGAKGGIFYRSWEIADPVGFNTSRRIAVTVSWTRRGHQRSIVLTTITKGGGT